MSDVRNTMDENESSEFGTADGTNVARVSNESGELKVQVLSGSITINGTVTVSA